MGMSSQVRKSQHLRDAGLAPQGCQPSVSSDLQSIHLVVRHKVANAWANPGLPCGTGELEFGAALCPLHP